MRRLMAVVPALLLGVSMAGAQPVGDAAAREQLLKVDRAWAAVAATRDEDKIVSYWTDDAAIYSPGEAPVAGKAAIRAYVADSLGNPGFAIAWTPREAEVAKSGDLGYTMGTNTFTIPGPQGSTTVQGRYVTVWRKTKDGWRCVVDFWHPAAAGK
jgi:ketosteroid isomerase-like protein